MSVVECVAGQDWVERTRLELQAESTGRNTASQPGLAIQGPLEPVPDNDWAGETWGLFWPDTEQFKELEETCNNINGREDAL